MRANRTIFPLRPCRLLLIGLSCWLFAPAAPAQDQKFTFNPPDNKRFVITTKDVRTFVLPRQETRKESSLTKNRVWIRKTPNGYTVTHTLLSATHTRNGKPYKSAIHAAMLNQPLTFITDPEGNFTAVKDLDVLSKKLHASASPQIRARGFFTKDLIETMLRADWNNLYGHFLDRSARPGETWTASGSFTLPSGELVPSTVNIRVSEAPACKIGSCVRTLLTHTGDPEMTRLTVENAIAQSLDLSKSPGLRLTIRDLQATETQDRIIDPSTMLNASRRVTGRTTYSLDVGGEVFVPVVLEQQVQEWYDYNPPKQVKSKTPAKVRPKPRPKRRSR